MIPQIHDRVHYVSHGSADGTYPSKCRPAVITEVPEISYGTLQELADATKDVEVQLFVMNPTGTFHSPSRRNEAEYRGGTWHYAASCMA